MLRTVLTIGCAILVTSCAAVTSARAAGPPNEVAVKAICTGSGGVFYGPDWVWRGGGSGYGCVVYGTDTPTMLLAPSIARVKAICSDAGGYYYEFYADYGYVGWGCLTGL